MQTKALPMTLMRKIMAYSESFTALKAGVSPTIASEVLSVSCGLNTELLFGEDEFLSM